MEYWKRKGNYWGVALLAKLEKSPSVILLKRRQIQNMVVMCDNLLREKKGNKGNFNRERIRVHENRWQNLKKNCLITRTNSEEAWWILHFSMLTWVQHAFKKNCFSWELIKFSGNTVLTYSCSPELAAVTQFLPEEKGNPEYTFTTKRNASLVEHRRKLLAPNTDVAGWNALFSESTMEEAVKSEALQNLFL